ncbi:MAG: GNAT family N-acetyltransferase [Clostridia bacterium]|nr:GNAT family N-acetyltransferase [Clostridia bacterium]
MQIEIDTIRLVPMTEEMYRSFFREYENDPDLLLPGQTYVPYVYSEEKVRKYIQKQRDRNRLPLAVLFGDDIAGEIILKDIEPRRCATMSITLKNAGYKDHGIGTRAERLAVQYVFDTLDIPTVYADTVRSNERSQHVLEKVGFSLIREDKEFRYYRIDKR